MTIRIHDPQANRAMKELVQRAQQQMQQQAAGTIGQGQLVGGSAIGHRDPTIVYPDQLAVGSPYCRGCGRRVSGSHGAGCVVANAAGMPVPPPAPPLHQQAVAPYVPCPSCGGDPTICACALMQPAAFQGVTWTFPLAAAEVAHVKLDAGALMIAMKQVAALCKDNPELRADLDSGYRALFDELTLMEFP